MTMTEPRSLSERMWDCSARVEHIIHFESMFTEPSTDTCEWLLDNMQDQIEEALGWEDGDEGTLRVFLSEDVEEFASTIARRVHGWAVQVATPQPRGMDEGHIMFSWGWYCTKVFLAETFDAALDEGIAWAEGIWADARVEADKNKPTAS